MVLRILLLLIVSIPLGAQVSQDSMSQPMADRISDVEINSTLIRATDNSISLGRKQFLTLAGALEDPTRLLIKFPGISTVNDQANSVVYHGMPAQLHRWSLYGARILNPNHLGNAGTISDFPARTSGGVNMFSGQAIGNLEFNGNPSSKTLDAISASSDMKLRDPFQNSITTNISLIGLEAGIDRISEDGRSSRLLNYRYSTVGLLTSLGLDFGGEVINFQDITGKYSKQLENGDEFSTYFSLGYDSNTKDPISDEDEPEEFKDLQEIDYYSVNLVAGVLYNKERSDFKFQNTLNVSVNSTGRSSELPDSTLNNPTTEYQSDEILLASKHEYTFLGEKMNWGFTFEPYLHVIDLDRDYPGSTPTSQISESLNRTALHLIPSIFSNYQLSNHFSVSGRLGVQSVLASEQLLDVVGQGALTYVNSGFTSSLRYARASQIFEPEILIYDIAPDLTVSENYEFNVSYKGIGASAFLHNVSNLPISTENYGFSGLENLDIVPIAGSGVPVVLTPEGEADIYGLSFYVIKNFAGINFSTNLTLMDSEHRGAEETTKAPLDYGHIFNFSLTKNWKINSEKSIGISAALHHRGGARQNAVDLARSFDWGYTNYQFDNAYAVRLADYYRIDFRILYKPSKRSTISLDIQNVTSRANDAFFYYEALTGVSTLQSQLTLIPILAWRVDW